MRILPDVDLPMAMQPCALCGGDAFETVATQDRHLLGLVTAGCLRCGLLQTNPRPSAAELAEFYAHHYRWLYQGVVDPSEQYVASFRKDERLRYTVDHLIKALGLNDHSFVLDYGCGEGSLFVALRKAGFRGRLAGVEPNPNFGAYAARSGQADVRAALEDFSNLDVVIVNHVLEHLPDPVGVLRDIRRRLEPTGWLYIDVPDAERYAHVGDLHLAHILHFTQRTLCALVSAAGYDIEACEAHEPPHHPLSLRLRARPSPGEAAVVPTYDVHTEAACWQHLRKLDARSWRWTLSQRLGRFGPIRSAYLTLRKWRTPAAPS